MSQRLIICSRQKEYVLRLAEWVDNRKELCFNLGICTSYNKLLRLEEKQDIDILVIDEVFPYELRCKCQAKVKFVLTQGTCTDLGEEEEQIYQFQSAAEITHIILERCISKESMNVFKRCKKNHHEIIAVYSPIHRIGKSEFAVALGKALSKSRKILYLSLEEYSGAVAGSGSTLADILYCLKQEGGQPGIKINTAVTDMGGVDTIAPIPFSTDLKEVEKEEWELLFQAILNESIYDTLILDFSESVRGLLSLLGMCDVIYMPVIEEERNGKKIIQYEQMLEKFNYINLTEKTVIVKMEGDKARSVREVLKGRKEYKSNDTGRDAI